MPGAPDLRLQPPAPLSEDQEGTSRTALAGLPVRPLKPPDPLSKALLPPSIHPHSPAKSFKRVEAPGPCSDEGHPPCLEAST